MENNAGQMHAEMQMAAGIAIIIINAIVAVNALQKTLTNVQEVIRVILIAADNQFVHRMTVIILLFIQIVTFAEVRSAIVVLTQILGVSMCAIAINFVKI